MPNTTQFGTSHKTASHTIRPELLQLPWRGDGPVMRGVDLCGFSDSEGRDTAFIEEMEEKNTFQVVNEDQQEGGEPTRWVLRCDSNEEMQNW